MITYKDIKKAVNGLLTKEFNIEINSNDVKEGFIRPSFFVSFDNQTKSSTLTQIEKSLTIRINYFPSDRYGNSIELMDMQEQLENLFDIKLPVKDRRFNIVDVTSTVTDGVLDFSFDIEFSDAKEISYEEQNSHPIEMMQTLDIQKG